MGWFGYYRNVASVVTEKTFDIEQTDYLQVVAVKETKTYGIILYRDTLNNNEHYIDSFIFEDGMYKPINFLDDFVDYFKRIPKKWHNVLSINPEQEEIINKQNNLVKSEAKKRKEEREKLEHLLVEGQIYSVWNGQFEAEYHGKIKRSHVFRLDDGQLTRFTKLKHYDLELVK